jgi:hypothetical protein
MAKAIQIAFPESSGIHRVRNFAEELSSTLGDLGDLPMEQADAATTKIIVSRIHARDLGSCRQFVIRLLERHLMAAEATISI